MNEKLHFLWSRNDDISVFAASPACVGIICDAKWNKNEAKTKPLCLYIFLSVDG